MKKASNVQDNETPRFVVVDWGPLVTFIADELAVCIKMLKKRRRGILEVQKDYFQSDNPSGEPNDMRHFKLAFELFSLDGESEEVKDRLNECRPKLFHDLANHSSCLRDEWNLPDSD